MLLWETLPIFVLGEEEVDKERIQMWIIWSGALRKGADTGFYVRLGCTSGASPKYLFIIDIIQAIVITRSGFFMVKTNDYFAGVLRSGGAPEWGEAGGALRWGGIKSQRPIHPIPEWCVIRWELYGRIQGAHHPSALPKNRQRPTFILCSLNFKYSLVSLFASWIYITGHKSIIASKHKFRHHKEISYSFMLCIKGMISRRLNYLYLFKKWQ